MAEVTIKLTPTQMEQLAMVLSPDVFRDATYRRAEGVLVIDEAHEATIMATLADPIALAATADARRILIEGTGLRLIAFNLDFDALGQGSNERAVLAFIDLVLDQFDAASRSGTFTITSEMAVAIDAWRAIKTAHPVN